MLCIQLIISPDETSFVIADYTSLRIRVNPLNNILKEIGVSPVSFPVRICKEDLL